MEFQLSQVALILNGNLEGDGNVTVNNLGKIEDAGPGSISFLSNPKYEQYLYTTRASAVIVKRDFQPKQPVATALIRVDDPYLSFTALLEEYQKLTSFQKKGLEAPHFIGTDSTYGENLYLGAMAYVGHRVTIGKNVKIYPQCYIGDEVVIGDNTIIYPGVKIYSKCRIGSHCTIQAGAVIGSHGFGFAPQPDGSYRNIPQVGNVILEDHVDVGANTTIDCATFESTIIRKGTKIDNLVQIAHNVEVGQHTVIAAQAGISGSTKVGNHVIMAGQVGVVGHIEIADRTTMAAKAGISKSTKEGDVLFGAPAFEHGKYIKSYVVFKKLPELMTRLQELEQKILTLSAPNQEK